MRFSTWVDEGGAGVAAERLLIIRKANNDLRTNEVSVMLAISIKDI